MANLYASFFHDESFQLLHLFTELDLLLARLGYITLAAAHRVSVYAVNGLCSTMRVARLRSFLPFDVLTFVISLGQPQLAAARAPQVVLKPTEIEIFDRRILYGNSAGTTMRCGHHSNEFHVIDNALSPDILAVLTGRLSLLPKTVVGSSSYFISFDKASRDNVRSPIERLILNALAPLVLGDLDIAVSDGYLGAEWWTQSRAADSPKEFHMDTAITWCRDNGWPTEMLTACHFYPTIGSIFYLSDFGGPTVVFNQSMGARGMSPLLPEEVLLVHPKKNRLLMFKGNRFHGVMKDDDGNSLQRDTLLVNYWRDKTAGEVETPTDPTDVHNMGRIEELLKSTQATPKHVSIERLSLSREFSTDLRSWQNQNIPESYKHAVRELTQSQQQGVYLFRLPQSSSVMKLLNSSDQYQNWHLWPITDAGSLTVLRLPNVNWREGMPGGDPFPLGKAAC